MKVLDKGYVGLVQVMGNDLTVANAARVSLDKRHDVLTQSDEKLIKFLWNNKHTSPFRHCALTFEVSAPMLVKNQWYKHAVASTHLEEQNGWNEISHRYVAEADEFYVPTEWRGAPANAKQGSAGVVDAEDYTDLLYQYIHDGKDLFESALAAGIAPEQARLFLPAYGLYVKWYWTVGLHALMNFLELRLDAHAQYEMQLYARAVRNLAKEHFPISMGLLEE